MQAFFRVPGRRCVQPAVRPRTPGAPYGLRIAIAYGPHDKAAFQTAALYNDLHLLRKI
jgi:hypothetical protein